MAYCLSIQVESGSSSHDFDGAFPSSLVTSPGVVGRNDERGAPVNSGSLKNTLVEMLTKVPGRGFFG